MTYYAVIDTNVLVSAMLKWDSVPGNVMELVFGGTIIPVLNDSILEIVAIRTIDYSVAFLCGFFFGFLNFVLDAIIG